MDTLERLRAWLDARREYAFEVVRIGLGMILFARGVWFITAGGDVTELLARSRWYVPGAMLLGHAVAVAHFAGGAMLTFGLATRLAAGVQVPVLLGAVFVVHLRSGFFGADSGLAFSVSVLVLLGLCVLYGGGRWSADWYLARSYREHHLVGSG